MSNRWFGYNSGMQEIKKRRIVIASVLKPVDDSRMFEKLGKTLAKEYEAWIVGFKGRLHNHANLYQIPLPAFSRISFGRILAPWKIFRRAWSIKPHVVVITTHELLFQGLLLKLFRGSVLVYDVQENYYRNILYTNSFPEWLRPLLAAHVRACERLTSPFISHYLMAEQGYKEELPFMAPKATVIANKYAGPIVANKAKKNPGLKLLFSGTLSKSTGVFRAIKLAEKLHKVDSRTSLTIIGHCSLRDELAQIKQAIHLKNHIQLIGGDHLVPHAQIIDAVGQSDAGIIAYEVTPATENSVPTKLYEYAANRLPILLYKQTPWRFMVDNWEAGVEFDDTTEGEKLLATIETGQFYPEAPADVLWESEEQKLLKIFRQLEI